MKALGKKLSIPVVLLSATDPKNYNEFYYALDEAIANRTVLNADALKDEYEKIEGFDELKALIPDNVMNGYSSLWLASKAIEGDRVVRAKIKDALGGKACAEYMNLIEKFTKGALQTGESKFKWIDYLLDGVVNKVEIKPVFGKFDKAITSRRWGKIIVILVVIGGLIGSFIPALPLMGVGMGISAAGAAISSAMTEAGCPGLLIGIVCNVLIQSLAFIVQMLGFVFGVTLVFGMLEEIGVMARISYVFDNTMGKLGLQGKSVMPFLVSFGCTMGGAAGARVIDNWGQKVLTIALAWAVPCGAAWSIIPMLSTMFFGPGAVLVIIVVLLVMLLHMWVTAKIFGRKLVPESERYGMIMELPPYHKPKWGALFRYVLGRTKDTFFRVVKVVIPICAIFWLLSYSPGSIEDSILYRIGTAIEPVTKIFGLNWQLFMAFVASSVGKEGAVGVLSALYSGTGTVFGAVTGANAAVDNLNQLLLSNIAKPEALAFIMAVTFNVPCIVAVAATYQETHSAKWTAKIAAYYTIGALILAFVAYHIGLLIW